CPVRPRAAGIRPLLLRQAIVEPLCTLDSAVATNGLALPWPASRDARVLSGTCGDDVGALVVPVGQTNVTRKFSEDAVAVRVSEGAVAHVRSGSLDHKKRT